MQSKSWNYYCDKRLSFIGAIEGKSIITLGPAYALKFDGWIVPSFLILPSGFNFVHINRISREEKLIEISRGLRANWEIRYG